MAQKWGNNDSARTMTRKYNETVDQINRYEKTNQHTEQTTEEIRKLLEGKVDKDTAKKDLGVDKVDNTADMDKPLSNPQARAIENATENMLTSQGIDVDIDGPEPGVLVEIRIEGSKIIMNTDSAQVIQKVNAYIKGSKLVLISMR